MDRQKLQKLAVTGVSSIGAVVIGLVVCGVILEITGHGAFHVYNTMWTSVLQRNTQYDAIQRATPLILAGCAVAIGFKMNLFNIGVEGQYRLAALFAAVVGAAISLPGPIHVLVELLVAVIVGAAWSSIAAFLKVKRGVNEVVSTIMLNFIAIGLAAWLFDTYLRDKSGSGLNVKTKLIPRSGWMPELVKGRVSSYFLVALAAAVLYWVVVFKSRFGFRLRASGQNDVAARTSGISSSRMIVTAMLMSGGAAGLIGMQQVLGTSHAYSSQGFVDGIGFLGIAVALLGRNHPAGIVLSALLFGALAASATKLGLQNVSPEIVQIIQGVIVLSVVIVNEATSRWLEDRVRRHASNAVLQTSVAQGVPA